MSNEQPTVVITIPPLLFRQTPGTGGRGWEDESGDWKIVMYGMGRYRLFHSSQPGKNLGEYATQTKAEHAASHVDYWMKQK